MGFAPPLTARVESRNGVTSIVLIGELDMATVPVLSEANGHRFILVGAGPAARRLFALTGTEFLLDEQEAVSLLARFAEPWTPPVQATVPDRGAHV